MMEFQQFNAIWDKKMEEFEMNAKQLTENMRKKHANELFRFKDKLQKSMVPPPPQCPTHRPLLDFGPFLLAALPAKVLQRASQQQEDSGDPCQDEAVRRCP